MPSAAAVHWASDRSLQSRRVLADRLRYRPKRLSGAAFGLQFDWITPPLRKLSLAAADLAHMSATLHLLSARSGREHVTGVARNATVTPVAWS